MKKTTFLGALLCLIFAAPSAHAWNQSELTWLTISTEHFNIQYHRGLERYAREAARIAESVYGPVTSFYRYEPDGKIYLNFSDVEDESQGSTYYYLNRIDISAAPYDFWFRGSSMWLADVITHEFTHMVSVQSSFKFPRRLPALYLQAVNFEKEKRPDVIYGYPNLQVSVPIPGELLPNWFAEGLAQYQCPDARHDFWDSHRDMLLRTAFINGKLLTLDEMGVFGKTSVGSELVYNQGFSLVRFIARRFGDAKLRELAASFSSLTAWSFAAPCRRVLGMSDDELYALWKSDLETTYYPVTARVREREIEGTQVAGKGFMNLFPVAESPSAGAGTAPGAKAGSAPGSPPGDFFYLSNRGRDYVDLDLMRAKPGGNARRVVPDVSSRFAYSPVNGRLCFSRRTRANKRGYLRNDLYTYDLAARKEKRLTRGLRAANPTWSPDGGRIACVVTENGVERIGIVDAGTGKHVLITPAAADREYTGLSWGARGILAARFEGDSRDVVLVDPETGAETPLVATEADERDPSWDADGAGFFYASDRSGIFNIYHHAMDGSVDLMATNCLGGAFNPAPDGKTGLLFSGYGADGFEIRALDDWRARAAVPDPSTDDAALAARREAMVRGGEGRSPGAAAAALDTSFAGAAGGEKKFGIEYTSLFFYPRVMIFQGRPRVGVFLDTGDYLGRQSVFAGATVGTNGEFDLNLAVETRQFKPTYGFEVYRSRTRYEYQAQVDVNSFYDFKVRYDLWDAYFTARMELKPTTRFSREEAVLQYNHGEYGVNVELWQIMKPSTREEFRGEGGWNYYLANELSLLFFYMSVRDEIDADINPRSGRSIAIEATRAYDKLHSGEFAFAFSPIYDKDQFGRYQIAYTEYIGLPFWRHAIDLELKAAAIDRGAINDFFYLYLGGQDGLRGYSYYSMGGTRLGLARLTYRFPVWRNIDRQFFGVYFASLYAGAFTEAGKVWTEDELDLRGNKKDVGFDLRLKGFTFHSYPIAASFEAAYGLDDVVYRDPFNTFAVFYEGKDWKYYGSILFSF
jgi:hypothetical protein